MIWEEKYGCHTSVMKSGGLYIHARIREHHKTGVLILEIGDGESYEEEYEIASVDAGKKMTHSIALDWIDKLIDVVADTGDSHANSATTVQPEGTEARSLPTQGN